MTKDWEAYKQVILEEYKTQNRPLHEVRALMEEKYNFKASIRAYRSRLDRWGITKYNRRSKRSQSEGALDRGDVHHEENRKSSEESEATMAGLDEPATSVGYGSHNTSIKSEPTSYPQLPMQYPAAPNSRSAYQSAAQQDIPYQQQSYGYSTGSGTYYASYQSNDMAFSSPVSPDHGCFSQMSNQTTLGYSATLYPWRGYRR